MNLVSQSKLTLKLKKQKDTSSTDLTNKCQKPDIIDSLKNEFSSDNSILSENDSFVEVLHSVQSNKEKFSASQSVFKTTLSDQYTSSIVNENKQCPICLQMVDLKKFIIHVKSCGTSHNLSSKVLIEAVDLQERQTAEREALGLPILTKNLDIKKKKCKVNKQTKLKIGSDSNLDLAIAMSVSLQESKNAEIIKESENLLEAGLEKEALEKRKTLENFGFISNQPVKSKPKSFSKTNSLLFKQTKEDREKRITEKVAMILIDVDTGVSSSESLINDCPNTKLVSKYLNSIRNIDNNLWKKSLLEEENICEFYVKQLSKFIKPCESNSIIGLKYDLKLPTHQNTLQHKSITNNEEFVDKLETATDNSNTGNIFMTSHNIIGNKTLLECSSKWKSMIGNQFMSDLTIYAKDEHEIPAHTLVFYVQCPDILDDVITEESDKCKSKKMLMWLEYSYEACLAFLELIYSGQESIIKLEFREDYLLLGTRYNIVMVGNSDEKHGWFSKDAYKVSKRKNSEFYNNSNDCKRYRASSPDMFMSDDINVELCSSANFLGTTVNDEKSLSMLRTKQWLYNQQQKSSSENFDINIPPQMNIPEKSPCHSFHSATTVSLKFTSSSNSDLENYDEKIKSKPDINILPKPLPMDESSMKNISVLQNNKKNVADTLRTPITEISKLTKSYKEPDLITINSDSENGSIDMIFCNDVTKSGHNNTFLSQSNMKNEKNNHSFNLSSVKYGNYLNTIELNDNSLDSIHSTYTNRLYQRNYNTKPNHSVFDDSVLNLKGKSINDVSTQIFSSSNNVIDLIEDSSDSLYTIDMTFRNNNLISLNNAQHNGQSYSTLFSTVTSSKESAFINHSDSPTQHKTNLSSLKRGLLSFSKNNESNFTKYKNETSDNFNLNSSNLSDISISSKNKDDSKLFLESPIQTFQIDNLSSSFSNTISHLKMNDVKDNDKSINRIFSNQNQNSLEKCDADSKLLKNILTTSLILRGDNYNDFCVNTNEVDSTFLPSNECINKNVINTAQVEPNQLSEITISNENDNEQNNSNVEQIIDDPWMDYNDWQAFNFSPQHVSPVLPKSNTLLVFEDESEVQTPKKNNLTCIHSLTPSSISNSSNNINISKKNSLTPNKYNNRISTPKSLRRVQSESIIGSKQVTPLPDYSSMKTPDLRKEFDRYGLKDLGRRKGKLILRHIYNVLHPLFPSEEDNCSTEFDQFSSSSDISEHGIPDYEDGSCDDIDIFNPNNLSIKISVESGFKEVLRSNEDLHKKILCYEPIWIEELKEDLKQHNVNISMQKLMTFLDDKCVTFRSKSLNEQRQKTLSKRNSKRKKLF